MALDESPRAYIADSVNVAKSTAEAIPKIERAYVFLECVEVRNTSSVVSNGGSSKRTITVTFKLRNHGKTPAILKELFADIRLCNDFSEATRASGTIFPPGKVISANDFYEFPWEGQVNAEDLELAETLGKSMLLFFGSVNYMDILNQGRVTAFCWTYDFSSKVFTLSLDPDHNYWT